MKEGHVTEQTICKLIDSFYAKVRADDQLGPIFSQAIGDEDEVWKPHLQKMYDFWSTIMLSTGRYHGNPFQKHLILPPFDERLFNRWLALFEEAARALHTEEIAIQYIEKSKRIAEGLKMGLSLSRKKGELK